MSGYSIVGQRHLTGDSGGPVARAVLPSRYGSDSEEDQVFLVASNMLATRDSVAAGAYCAVDGIGEKIAVDVLDAALPAKLLGALGTDQWQVRNFLDSAGLPETLPEDAAARRQAVTSVTALKCRRPLPPGRDMALAWARGSRDRKSTRLNSSH